MSLNLSLLQNVKQVGSNVAAQCPACAEHGDDKKGNHLIVYSDGRFGCAKYQGDQHHRKRIFALVGDKKNIEGITQSRFKPLPILPRPPRPPLPHLITDEKRVEQLISLSAKSRGLHPAAFLSAYHFFKTLHFCKMFNHPCWIVTDEKAPGYEARRVDGKPFEQMGSIGERKSHSKGKGLKSWPVGIVHHGFDGIPFDPQEAVILLVEGTPDLMAGYMLTMQLELDYGMASMPCAMLGKGSDISPEALPYFQGRKVVIIGHDDAESRIMAWYRQLQQTGIKKVIPIKLGQHDLNDLFKERPGEIPGLCQAIKKETSLEEVA